MFDSDQPRRRCIQVLLCCLSLGAMCLAAQGAVGLLGTQYTQDNMYPEYACIYRFGNYPTNCGVEYKGSYAHVFIKNTGTSAVTINDVTLAGYSLKTVLKRDPNLRDSASIWYYWDNPPSAIINAGEPVWYRADPNPIPAGGTARAVIRLRWVPSTSTISVGVVTSAGTINTTITKDAESPRLASVGFSSDRTKVYLHWRRAGGAAPSTIYMNGVDVTSNAATVGDPNTNYAATVLTFASPLANMSYNVYQGVYSDGKTATGSLRTWVNRFLYGTWGVKDMPEGDFNAVRSWIDSCHARGVNCYVNNSCGVLQDFMATSEGQAYAAARDYGYVKDNAWGNNPRMWFIDDEPDLEEGNIACGTGMRVPCGGGYHAGILGMKYLDVGEVLRAYNPSVPTTINIDGNFKPDGWYAYGQLADVLMVDSYHEEVQADSHWFHPERDVLFAKNTSIYAAAIAGTTAAEPNPFHLILYSNSYKNMAYGYIWPYPSPASKQIQAFYALAGGVKGMSYWWFKSGWPYYGLDSTDPNAVALWKQIGIIGNYIKTAQPLLVKSHPVSAALQTSEYVWAKALAVGTDAMMLIAVTDNYYTDEYGYHSAPVTNATVTVTLPSWLQNSPQVFEITPNGTSVIGAFLNGNQLLVPLGTVNLTRMIVITTDSNLRSDIESRYLTYCRPGICSIAPEYCTAQNTTPTITLQPGNVTVQAGSAACFTVLAAGTGTITYQWQKNGVNISDGTDVAGATTSSLILSDVDANDAGNYRCVVTNSYGSVNSGAGTLTVTPPPCGTMTNASFEGGNTNGVAEGWTAYQRSPNPTSVWSIQTSSPPAGAGSQYQQIANTSSTGGGGVRQVISGCIPGVQYTVLGWMRTNSSSATATVKVSPTASTDWSTAVHLSPAQSTTSSTWVRFSGTVVATGTSMTIWLDGHTGGTGLNKVVCFDGVQVTCWPPQAPTITQQPTAQNVCPGTNAQFAVTATGQGTLTYQWQKNQVHLTNGGPYSGCTTPTLTIAGVTSAEAANYRCLVADSVGSAWSDEAALTLKVATSITQQPADQNVCPGANASFTVAAAGDGTLTYQWQKNSVNLTNGGHYSGCTTATLTITGADGDDEAAYRCVVTGGCGIVASSEAWLTVETCSPPILVNNSFEGGNTGGVASGWTGYQRATNPTTVWSIQTASPPAGAGAQYQQIANTSASGGGGVRQNVTGCTVGASYTISGWMRTNSASATATVKVSPTASTDWSTAIDLSPAQSTTSSTWVRFSGTVVATGTSMTIWLDGHTGGTGLNKAVCFDDVTIACTP
ncbi:MAG: immunoglobulin domain-containing protein [Phycisphaerae bacterium]